MTESRILAAFWQPNAKRFVALTGSEILDRSGLSMGSPEGRSLTQRGFIRIKRLGGTNTTDNRAYSLSPAGERRVSAMVVMGTIPKPVFRLTANPMKGVVR